MKLISLCVLWSFSFHATAAVVTWQFSTVIDASKLGGTKDMPLSMVYTFDSAQAGGFRGDEPGYTSFGPVTVNLTLGNDTVTSTGAEIFLWNNMPTSVNGNPPYTDGYSVNANATTITGELLGRKIWGFGFTIFDNDQNIFTGKPTYPELPDFAALGDYQMTTIYPNFDFDLVTPTRTPYSLTVIPEPLTSLSAGLACGYLASRRRKR